MGKSVVAVVCLLPIFWCTVLVPIWGNDLPFELYVIHIERVVVTKCAEPNILCVVLPIRFCSPTFFAFPCDSVANIKYLSRTGKTNVDVRQSLQTYTEAPALSRGIMVDNIFSNHETYSTASLARNICPLKFFVRL